MQSVPSFSWFSAVPLAAFMVPHTGFSLSHNLALAGLPFAQCNINVSPLPVNRS